MSDFTKNMNAGGGPAVVAKQTGYAKVNFAAKRTATVLSVGDPVADTMELFKNPPGVRDGARQTRLSSKQGADKPIKNLILSANKVATTSE